MFKGPITASEIISREKKVTLHNPIAGYLTDRLFRLMWEQNLIDYTLVKDEYELINLGWCLFDYEK